MLAVKSIELLTTDLSGIVVSLLEHKLFGGDMMVDSCGVLMLKGL